MNNNSKISIRRKITFSSIAILSAVTLIGIPVANAKTIDKPKPTVFSQQSKSTPPKVKLNPYNGCKEDFNREHKVTITQLNKNKVEPRSKAVAKFTIQTVNHAYGYKHVKLSYNETAKKNYKMKVVAYDKNNKIIEQYHSTPSNKKTKTAYLSGNDGDTIYPAVKKGVTLKVYFNGSKKASFTHAYKLPADFEKNSKYCMKVTK